MFNWFQNRRRKQYLTRNWPADWTPFLERNVRHFLLLDSGERQKLKQTVSVMVEEKRWEGHNGLDITEEVKVTIAGSAALMLLGVEDYYYDAVKTIIVFPNPIRRKTQFGWVVDENQFHAGEAFQGGPVVLSWHDVLVGARNDDDGHNLVVHEFAHCLDGLDGAMDGEIRFSDHQMMEQWKEVVRREYEDLCDAAEKGRNTLLDHYGATNPAEFFAVASETFFELPVRFSQKHAELYHLLTEYYRVDPKKWFSPFTTG